MERYRQKSTILNDTLELEKFHRYNLRSTWVERIILVDSPSWDEYKSASKYILCGVKDIFTKALEAIVEEENLPYSFFRLLSKFNYMIWKIDKRP